MMTEKSHKGMCGAGCGCPVSYGVATHPDCRDERTYSTREAAFRRARELDRATVHHYSGEAEIDRIEYRDGRLVRRP